MDERTSRAFARALSRTADESWRGGSAGQDNRYKESASQNGEQAGSHTQSPNQSEENPTSQQGSADWDNVIDGLVSGREVDIPMGTYNTNVDRKRYERISPEDRAAKFVIEPWMVLLVVAFFLTASFVYRVAFPIIEKKLFSSLIF